MKRLTKSFIAGRCTELVGIPLSWCVKNVENKDFFILDLRLSLLENMEKQVTYVFDEIFRNSLLKLNKQLNYLEDCENKLVLEKPELILKIDLSLNQLTTVKMSDFAPFIEVRCLDLSLNCIESFSGIIACPKLTAVYLSYNNIHQLPKNALEHCHNLQILDLRSNQLTDLTALPPLPNLKELNVSFNALMTLDGLHVLPILQEIHAENNRINNIVGISACTKLRHVHLSNNCLDLVKDLAEVLKHLIELVQVDLNGNSVSDDPLLLKSLKCSSLVIVNGKSVKTAKEKFAGVGGMSPPAYNDEDRQKLKEAVREAMEENLQNKQLKHDASLHFLHTKLLSLLAEMDTYKEKLQTDTEAWCSYIDTISPEEVEALSMDKIRNFALKTDGLYVVSNGKKLVQHNEGPSKQKNKFHAALRDPKDVLKAAAGVLSQSTE
ncbi:unnamed protein product [Clavelina lepadiformis]|uniref:Uncharacterized protein n=1 Tax=Clavelina lepadiformis TaxID=159417 RepID=A0ABP0GT38_CLALP